MLPDDPNDHARFFYLALLGMFVASGVFYNYRERMGTALQHAAIWVLIFLGATLVYGFKDQLASQLNPYRASISDERTVSLRRARDGHFYARVEVNGTDIKFMVDTGASSVVLSRRDAERVGIELDSLNYTIPVSTANGRVMGAGVRLARIEFGGIADNNVRAMVNGGDLNSSLLGMDYLDRFRSVRIEGDTLFLER